MNFYNQSNTQVVVTTTAMSQKAGEWSTDICGCCSDMNTCKLTQKTLQTAGISASATSSDFVCSQVSECQSQNIKQRLHNRLLKENLLKTIQIWHLRTFFFKVASDVGVSPACNVRQPVNMDGAAACHCWTVAVWCPAYCAILSESATTSL